MFLATTAVEEFWDKDKKLLFLGEWCKLYTRQGAISKLNYTTMPYIWNKHSLEDAMSYCDKVYKSVLKEIIPVINIYHNVNHDHTYWDIFLRPWLYRYIQIMYDKYLTIKKVYTTYDDLTTFIMKEEDYKIIFKSWGTTASVENDDYFNLQLYSQVIRFLKLRSNEKDLNFKFDYHRVNTIYKRPLHDTLLKTSSYILNKLFQKKSITLANPRFKHSKYKSLLKLIIKSKFLFTYDSLNYHIDVPYKFDLNERKKVFSNLRNKNNSEFISLIFNTLSYNFPLVFFENYHYFNEKVKALPIKKTDAIFSTSSFHNDEVFRFYYLQNFKDTKLLYFQTGGNFDINKVHTNSMIEKPLIQHWYGYGTWNKKNLPQAKIEKNTKTRFQILFIQSVFPRYLYNFQINYMSSNMLIYFKNNQAFINTLEKPDYLTIRDYPLTYKWSLEERFKEFNKTLKFNNKIDYYTQITNSELVVFNHMHTGYLETLSNNIPTIIFIDPDIEYFKEEAKEYLNMLIDANILFESPIKAAEFINTNYSTINKWWNSNKVQKARKNYCDMYIRVSDDWEKEWIEKLALEI